MLRSDISNLTDEEFLAQLARLPTSEKEWLSCDEPPKLMAALLDRNPNTTDRKIRLYACAAARLYLSTHPADVCYHDALAVAERFVEGSATAEELQRAGREAEECYQPTADNIDLQIVRHAAYLRTRGDSDSVRYATSYSSFDEKTNSLFFRCIFGNPFRPVSFCEEWRTDTAVALARQMYESREFGAMPILADALQDAGCDNEDILSHCRGDGPHVRGCWVVDLVLGKE
jgi:hypothetical protein